MLPEICHLAVNVGQKWIVPMEGPGRSACGKTVKGHWHPVTRFLIGDQIPSGCSQGIPYCRPCVQATQDFLDAAIEP